MICSRCRSRKALPGLKQCRSCKLYIRQYRRSRAATLVDRCRSCLSRPRRSGLTTCVQCGGRQRRRPERKTARGRRALRERMQTYRVGPGHAVVLLVGARARARARGLACTITADDLVVPKRCPLLGIRLAPGRGKMHDSSPTIDRIDSRKGYVRGNVWIISWRANRMKSDATLREIETLARNLRRKCHGAVLA